MQTMPAKTKRAVLAGAVTMAALVALFALLASNRNQEPAPTQIDEFFLTPNQSTSLSTIPPVTIPETSTPAITEPTIESTVIPPTHTVQEGETLYSISRQYYNDHIYAGDIERLNELQEPNKVIVGQELKLPRAEELKKVD